MNNEFETLHEPTVRENIVNQANYVFDTAITGDMFARLEMEEGSELQPLLVDQHSWRGFRADRMVMLIPEELAEREVLYVDGQRATSLTLLRPFAIEGPIHPSVSDTKLVTVMELEDGTEATTVIGEDRHFTASPHSVEASDADKADTNSYLGRILAVIQQGEPLVYLPPAQSGSSDQAVA